MRLINNNKLSNIVNNYKIITNLHKHYYKIYNKIIISAINYYK